MGALKFAFCVIFAPVSTFRVIKARRSASYALPIFILAALLSVIRLITPYITHFPLQSGDLYELNPVWEVALLVVPLLTWGVAGFAVSSILSGECKLQESLMGTLSCAVPFIIFALPLSLISHLFSSSSAAFYHALWAILAVWICILLFVCVVQINQFSFKKAVFVCVLTILFCVLIWAVCLLVYVLANKFITFAVSVYEELRFVIWTGGAQS